MSRKLALIIGNSHYQDPRLAQLVTPSEDVNDLTALLRDPAIGNFEQVTTLINEIDAVLRLSTCPPRSVVQAARVVDAR